MPPWPARVEAKRLRRSRLQSKYPGWHAPCLHRCMQSAASTTIAVAVWQDRVSPVFDTSRHLLVLRVAGREVVDQREMTLGSDEPLHKAAALTDAGVSHLVCGALSRPLAELLAARGIAVTPFVCGCVENVVAALLENRLADPALAMPGCCGRRRNRCGWNEVDPGAAERMDAMPGWDGTGPRGRGRGTGRGMGPRAAGEGPAQPGGTGLPMVGNGPGRGRGLGGGRGAGRGLGRGVSRLHDVGGAGPGTPG